jgi:hypothetical protein
MRGWWQYVDIDLDVRQKALHEAVTP